VGEMNMHSEFLESKLQGKYHLIDRDIDGTIMLKYILDKHGCEVADWIHFVQNRVQWRTVLSMEMNFYVP
jgi:hypothetical protein